MEGDSPKPTLSGPPGVDPTQPLGPLLALPKSNHAAIVEILRPGMVGEQAGDLGPQGARHFCHPVRRPSEDEAHHLTCNSLLPELVMEGGKVVMGAIKRLIVVVTLT